MSDKINHRRKNKPRKADRHSDAALNNGYNPRAQHGNLDKAGQSWGTVNPLSDRTVGASVGYNFSNGSRGMAKAVRGAKKFVKSRTRFHENLATKKLAKMENDTI